MPFKLKRKRRPNNKSVLLKKLKELEAKDTLTSSEQEELDNILALLNKKRTNKIESKKLNNTKQNEQVVVNVSINNVVNGNGSKSDPVLNADHFKSASGSYRGGRIDNRKNLKSIN